MDINMSKIISIHRSNEEAELNIGPRKLAIDTGNMTIILDFVYLAVDTRQSLKGGDLKSFQRKFATLSRDELHAALQVPEDEFLRCIQLVECIGCRRIIERMFQQFKRDGSLTLDPFLITADGTIRIRPELLANDQLDLARLLQKSLPLYTDLLTPNRRHRQTQRCTIHNLDAYKVTPFSETWTQVWTAMRGTCREKVLIVDMDDLRWTLDFYLKKHKFCHECSAKVETAFHLLFREKNPKKEPGYAEELYAGIRRCLNKHIQLPCRAEFIDMLIRRAEPELVDNGNRSRERHAKTLEIAQEEVLTCIGMCVFERLRRIHQSRREEEGACQLLATLALHGMHKSFELAVERKRGISSLDLLYAELSQAEQQKEAKMEKKREKKRQKKMEKRSLCSSCRGEKKGGEGAGEDEEEEHSHGNQQEDEEEEENCPKHGKVTNCHGGGDGGSELRSKKAKRKTQSGEEENGNFIGEKGDDEEEDDDDEPSLRDLELIVAHKTSVKSQNNQNQVKKQMNNNKIKAALVKTVKKEKEKKKSQEKETLRGARLPAVRATEARKSPEADHHHCATCEEQEIEGEEEKCVRKKPLQSQPISLDCGYVSDQLSLTNCSSTSVSSLDDQKSNEIVAQRVINTSNLSDAPCSSPLTINSQLSSLSSTPEGSEVACQEGLCNHPVVGDAESQLAMEKDGDEQKRCTESTLATFSPLAPPQPAGSYIPEELINEFRSKHRDLQASREELRRNLRQNFDKFCLANKNRSLSHLCRCLDENGEAVDCSDCCE